MKTPIRTLLKILILTIALIGMGFFARAQTPTTVPSPFQQATNQSAATLIFNSALSLLPAWDPTQTNDFQAHEFTLESAPLWKSMTTAGTTPYNSTEADYFLTRNIGVGGELISLGNGSGNNTIDTINVPFTLRKDLGNIAGYISLAPGYGFNFTETSKAGKSRTVDRPEVTLGPGIIYQYQTHLRLFIDTRYEISGKNSSESGFLTRVGLQIPF